MADREKVLQTIFHSIDEINEQLPSEEKLKKSMDTPLFGDGGNLDSLGLVSFVTTIERRIEEDFNVMLTLFEDMTDLESENPFRNVKELTDFVVQAVEKKSDGQ